MNHELSNIAKDKYSCSLAKIISPSFVISLIALLIAIHAHYMTWYVKPKAEISIIEDCIICQNFTDNIYTEISGFLINEGKRSTSIKKIEIKYTFIYPYINIIKCNDVSFYELEKTYLSKDESIKFSIIDFLYFREFEFDLKPEYLDSIEISIIHDDGKRIVTNRRIYTIDVL